MLYEVITLVHALVYTLPFVFITRSPWALGVICFTHALIDRYRLAHYVTIAKNIAGDPDHWRDYLTHSGYAASTPPWMAAWLVIIIVITSYSIHYTKLYDGRDACLAGGCTCANKSGVMFALGILWPMNFSMSISE